MFRPDGDYFQIKGKKSWLGSWTDKNMTSNKSLSYPCYKQSIRKPSAVTLHIMLYLFLLDMLQYSC